MTESKSLSHLAHSFGSRVLSLAHSGLGRNIIFLYLLQGLNYLLPFVAIPYLARVLQPEHFGMVAVGQGFVAYLVLLVSFGFNWSGTRQIAVNRSSPDQLNQIASSIWAAKALIAVVGLLLLFLLAAITPKVGAVLPLVLVLFGLVVGEVMTPVWLFQGMERMATLAGISIGVRILSTAGVILLVHRPDDYLIYAALLATDALITGSLGMIAALRLFQIHLVPPSLCDIWSQFRGGWALFLTCGASSLYTTGNSFILGLVTNHVTVGYFNAAERLVRAANQALAPIEQAVFPVVNHLAGESRESALRFTRRLLPLLAGLGLLVSIGLMAGAPVIVRVVFGPAFGPSSNVLRVLAPVVLNLSLTTVWSTLLMIAFRRDWAILSIIAVAGCLNLILGIILAGSYGAVGMAAAYLTAEVLVNVATFSYTWRHRINPLRTLPVQATEKH